MKKLYFILALAFLMSCTSTYQMTTTTVSFENYSRNGFLITTSSINAPYQSLGIVSADCKPGLVTRNDISSKKEKGDDIYNASPIKHTGQWGICSKADLVDALYIQAKELNATALIDVKFYDYAYGSTVYHSATGLAVKVVN